MLFFDLLKLEFIKTKKNSGLFLQNILFFVISNAIFLLLAKDQNLNLQNYLAIIILISLIFSLIFVSSNFLNQDFEDGTLEQIILVCENFEIFILAKIIANWFFYGFSIIISSYFLIKLLGISDEFNFKFLTLLFFSSISISAICGFCSSLNLSTNKSFLIAIFIFPLIIPVLLIMISGIFDQELFFKSLKILLAIDILFLIISVFSVSKIVKILSD